MIENDPLRSYWTSHSGYCYNNGFTSLRKLHDNRNNKNYKICCKIYSSVLQKPLFQCVVETDYMSQTFVATNPTTAMKKVFNYVGAIPNRTWNGNHFFGLHRKDVKLLLKNAPSKIITADSRNPDSVITSKNSKVNWMGVITVGDVEKNIFVKNVGSNKLVIPIGYESVQNIKLNEKIVALHCKVEDGPQFSCFTLEDPIVRCTSSLPSDAVRKALNKLNITFTRRWSGYEFFGLSRSDVISQINSMMNSRNKDVSCQRDTNSVEQDNNAAHKPKLLKEVMDIRHRNAGPTSSLCSKAQMHRNELVHKLVEFATFGDVKGIYFIYIYTL